MMELKAVYTGNLKYCGVQYNGRECVISPSNAERHWIATFDDGVKAFVSQSDLQVDAPPLFSDKNVLIELTKAVKSYVKAHECFLSKTDLKSLTAMVDGLYVLIDINRKSGL